MSAACPRFTRGCSSVTPLSNTLLLALGRDPEWPPRIEAYVADGLRARSGRRACRAAAERRNRGDEVRGNVGRRLRAAARRRATDRRRPRGREPRCRRPFGHGPPDGRAARPRAEDLAAAEAPGAGHARLGG